MVKSGNRWLTANCWHAGNSWLIGLCLFLADGAPRTARADDADSPAPSAAAQPADAIGPSEQPESPSSDEPAAQPADKQPVDKTTQDDPLLPAAQGDPTLYDLKYKLRVGETLRSEVVHRATVENTIKGASQTAEMRSKSVKAWTVTQASADRITFVHAVESVDMWQRMQGRAEVTYNSATDKKPPAGYEAVAAAVGKPLTVVTIDERGTVLKREEKHPQPDMQTPQITIPLPKQPAALGYVWTAPLDIDVLLSGGATRKIHTQQRFVLEKVVDGVATIQLETQVLTPVNDAAIEAQLIQRLSSGVVKFDIDSGRVIGQQLDLDRRVIGCAGPGSSMHYLMRFTEKSLPPGEPQTASRKAKSR